MENPIQLLYDHVTGSPCSPAWDALWRGESIGRLALAVWPNADHINRLKERVSLGLEHPADKPAAWTPDWRTALEDGIYGMLATVECPGDRFPAIPVPRSVHGQSQGMTDIFGCRVEARDGGLCHAHPLPADPAVIDAVEPQPIEKSRYWGAIEWLRYAREATGGLLPFRVPVMTGPIDTANYLLGTTVLMEWVYSRPDTVHRLLAKITDVIIRMLAAAREAAGGELEPGHFSCMRGGFDLCSEVRSIISREVYEEFEAPYLRRIGEALGTYAIHSCGSWERTIPSALGDPNLRAMHGQLKENDLATLCELAGGKIALSVGPSANVHTRYLWPDTESYHRHVLTTAPASQPMEAWVVEDDLPTWKRVYREVFGRDPELPDPAWVAA